MAELRASDLEEWSGGRIPDDDDTELKLRACLMSARRAVGWHVSPVLEDQEITLDGPGSRILWLPARKIVELTSVFEDDVELDVVDLSLSAEGLPYRPRPASLRKKSGGWWTSNYGGIVVTMNYGFTEVEAADWRQAIMQMVDQVSMATTGISESNLSRKTIDDVTYQYANPYTAMADEAVGSVYHVLCDYALPTVELI
jgi:hypothetical protein